MAPGSEMGLPLIEAPLPLPPPPPSLILPPPPPAPTCLGTDVFLWSSQNIWSAAKALPPPLAGDLLVGCRAAALAPPLAVELTLPAGLAAVGGGEVTPPRDGGRRCSGMWWSLSLGAAAPGLLLLLRLLSLCDFCDGEGCS